MGALALVVLVAISAPLAVAAPGVVVAAHASARAAPLEGARVVQELVAGYPVCIVDDTGTGGPSLTDTPDWTMVQLAPPRGFAYVLTNQIRPAPESATTSHICDSSPAIPSVAALPRQPQQRADPDRPHRGSYWRPGVTDRAPSGFLPLDPWHLSLGLATGAAWVSRSAAEQQRIGTVGPTFYLTFGMVIYDVFSISSSLGAVFPADRASFSQDVMPLLGGSTTSASSSIQVTNYSIAVGPRTPLLVLGPNDKGGVVFASLFADYGWSRIAGERSIDNCSDCRTESLDLVDGSFVRAGLDIGSQSIKGTAVVFNLAYQSFLANAALTREIRIGFSLWFL